MKMSGAAWVGVVLLLTLTLGLFWYWEGKTSVTALCLEHTLFNLMGKNQPWFLDRITASSKSWIVLGK
jgi:hypothetical protein